MGLDIVDLVLAVEDEFEVCLEEDDYREIRTVGDLYRTICSQVDAQRQLDLSSCPSIKPFFAVRDALLSLTTSDSRAIRPSSSLETLLVKAQRRTIWPQLQSLARIRLPPLELPVKLDITLKFTAATGFLVSAWISGMAIGPSGVLLSAVCTSIFLTIGLVCTRSYAIAFPSNCQTVGDIIQYACPPAYPRRPSKAFSEPSEIWPKLVRIISDRLDVPIEEITRGARFIEDLKCD